MHIIWGVLVSAGMWLFRSRIGLIFAAMFAWLGVNIVTFKVVLEPTIDLLNNTMLAAESAGASTLPGVMWQWFQVLQFPGALQMVVTAYATRAGVRAGLIALARVGA